MGHVTSHLEKAITHTETGASGEGGGCQMRGRMSDDREGGAGRSSKSQ